MNLKELIKQDVANILKIDINDVVVEKPKNKTMGDYALPCFNYSKVMRKSPMDIANNLSSELNNKLYDKVEVVSGYVNVFLNKKVITENIIHTIMNEKSNYGNDTTGNGKVIVIDYSAPNIAKPFGVGHLRSTVIGNSLKKICEKLGYKVVGINHLGDWGTQFGKLIYAYKNYSDEEKFLKNPIEELRRIYVLFHENSLKDPSLDDEGRKWFKKLEDGDLEALRLWEWFRLESLKEFNKTYELLNIKDFDSYNGEAFYNDKMDSVVKELEDKKLLEISEGASVVNLSDDMPPALIKRSDGATLYITRDLAAVFYRMNNYHFDEALYVVGNEQTLHFKQFKAVISKMGYSWSNSIQHISFGMILQNGKKMSTRQGKSVGLHGVLLEAIDMSKKHIEENNPTLEDKDEVSRKIGVGAVIYNDLRNYRSNDIEFNLNDILNFNGETGPYIQYTYARIMSLLSHKTLEDIDYNEIDLNDYIWNVMFALYEFPFIIKEAKENYDPSRIAKYIMDLSQGFNKLYATERFLTNDKKQVFFLNLSDTVATVLKEGMTLLGIEMPNRM